MFYTKYRPKKLEDLFGQDHIVKTLSEAIKQNKIAHGYLFCGPRGTGKTTVARILAQSINCTDGGVKPCGKCQSCTNISAGKSIDIIEIDAASNRGIDEIRDLREKVNFAPNQSKYKVYIIDEVHMLTKEAFNALLKTLEEPPAHVVFIFATTEAHKVLPTIISRCQRYDFHRADATSIVKLLQKVIAQEQIKADVNALALIARAADGAYRDGLTLLEQLASEGTEITADDVRQKLGLIAEPLMWQLIAQAFSGQKKEVFETYKKFIDQGTDWKYLTTSLLQKLKTLLFYKIAPSVLVGELVGEEKKYIEKIAQKVEEASIVRFINLLLRAESELRFASLQEVPLGAGLAEFQIGDVAVESKKLKVESGRPSSDPKDIEQEAQLPEVMHLSVPNAKPVIEDKQQKKEALFSLSDEDWNLVIAEIKKKNSTLAGLLKQAKPVVDASKIILEVPYKLWADKIKSPGVSQIICETACRVIKKDIQGVDAISNSDMRQKVSESHKKEDAKLVDDAKDVFG